MSTEGGRTIDAGNEKTRNITVRLNVLARMLRNQFDRKVADLNITRSQWAMIVVVARYPGATQRVIAETLEMSEASAGRLIDRLCAEGLLERRDREDDRRARAVYVTKAAEPLLTRLGEIAQEGDKVIFAGFSDEDLGQLQAYLDRIYANALMA